MLSQINLTPRDYLACVLKCDFLTVFISIRIYARSTLIRVSINKARNFKMKKLIITSITAILLSSSVSANAANGCRNIFFAVKNDSSDTIRLLKVSYTNLSSGRTKTENFRNGTCPTNNICKTLTGQRLANARDSRLDDFYFHYQTLNSSTGNWSIKRRSSVFKVNNPICIANRTYGGRHWQITD